MVMGLCTAAIGFLPSYDQGGEIGPILLIILRIIQGFALGGEWGGAALMSVEHAPKGRRGLWAAPCRWAFLPDCWFPRAHLLWSLPAR